MKVITAEKTIFNHIAVIAEKNPTANFIAATRETTTSYIAVITAEKTTLSHIAICLQQ